MCQILIAYDVIEKMRLFFENVAVTSLLWLQLKTIFSKNLVNTNPHAKLGVFMTFGSEVR